MSDWFLAANALVMNSYKNRRNSNAKLTNSIANELNSIAKVTNSTANGTKSTAKVSNLLAKNLQGKQRDFPTAAHSVQYAYNLLMDWKPISYGLSPTCVL